MTEWDPLILPPLKAVEKSPISIEIEGDPFILHQVNEKPILCHVNLATGYRGGERQTQLLMELLSSLGWQQMLIARKAGILAHKSRSIDSLKIYETSLNPLQYFLSL